MKIYDFIEHFGIVKNQKDKIETCLSGIEDCRIRDAYSSLFVELLLNEQ